MNDFEPIIAFLKDAERLKSTRRSAWTSTGEPETVAAHTWRLCLMALVLADQFPEVNLDRVLRILLVHDLGEALHGDIPAPQQGVPGAKAEDERRDLLTILAPLPATSREGILALWDEYEACQTPEARLAKGLDKLETIMQHNQGKNPAGFDYGFNLEYGRRFTGNDPRLAILREMLDRETAARSRQLR
ncbi:MAG TPA: HD domain-containing protein [Gemmatimonadales bacterium]|nr:HD domain-containing protein [Gemmatimonadales bacterium]